MARQKRPHLASIERKKIERERDEERERERERGRGREREGGEREK